MTEAVHDNLRNLGLDVLEVVNLRIMPATRGHGPSEGSIEAPLTALAELQRKGLVRHIGLSNATSTQVAEGRRIAEIVCVQNHYNLIHRDDDALIDDLARDRIAYVPFFPLGGFTIVPALRRRGSARRHADASRTRVAAAARAQHPAESRDLVGGAPPRKPRRGRTRASPERSRRAGWHATGRVMALRRETLHMNATAMDTLAFIFEPAFMR